MVAHVLFRCQKKRIEAAIHVIQKKKKDTVNRAKKKKKTFGQS